MSNFSELARKRSPAQKWDRDVEDHENAAQLHYRWATFWECLAGYGVGRLLGASRWARGQRHRATELRHVANKMRTCIHRPLGAGAPDRRTVATPIGVDSTGRTVYSVTSLDDPVVQRPGRLVRLGDVDRETDDRLAAGCRKIEDLLG